MHARHAADLIDAKRVTAKTKSRVAC